MGPTAQWLTAVLLVLSLTVTLGCKRDPEDTDDDEDAAEKVDPTQPCRDHLRGVWRWGSLTANCDGGVAIISYDGDTKVFGASFFDCQPNEKTRVQAEGYTIDIEFHGDDKIEVSTADFDGSLTLRREKIELGEPEETPNP